MSQAAVAHPSVVDPLNEPSRGRRLLKVGGWLLAIVLVVVVLDLLGVDVVGWLSDLWSQIKDVPPGYIVAALIFQSGQTVFAGLSYYGILRAAYPGQVEFWPIVTAYAVGVAMNNFLPANIGTFATLVMFCAIIPSCTFPGALAAYLVQKIFFTVAGTFVYAYLFLSVPGSFNESLGNLSEDPLRTILIAAGVVILIVILAKLFWKQLKKLWAKAKRGGVILAHPKQYFLHSFLPALLSWLCKLVVIGIFLAAFAIPVTFESIMWVTGSGSLANVVSVTPGAVGITQATNALALDSCCSVDKGVAVDYSTAQQLHHDRLECALRVRARGDGLRLAGRQAARHAVVRRREGQGGRAEGSARREEGGEESSEGSGARRVRTRRVPSPPRRRRCGGCVLGRPRRRRT